MTPMFHAFMAISYSLAATAMAVSLPSIVPGSISRDGLILGLFFFAIAMAFHLTLSAAQSRSRLKRQISSTQEELKQAQSELERLGGDVERIVGRSGESQSLFDEMRMISRLLSQLADARAGRKATESEEPPGPPPDHLIETIEQAIKDNRVDLYLQPVVRLPQRKIAYYEAYSRIRDGQGSVIAPTQYIATARESGLITTIDNLLMFRCVQLVRRARQRSQSIGFFINISANTLSDREFMTQFIEFLDDNRDLTDALIFEFMQSDLEAASSMMQDALSRLHDMGFTFSMDQVTRLDIDFNALWGAGFRFLKIDAPKILSADTHMPSDIEVGDLGEMLTRAGIELIAGKVEDENTVIGLLDLEIGLAQGYLFGVPKPPSRNL